jgi:hypothetical protein
MPAPQTRDRYAAAAAPPNDAYTILLMISLGALLFGCVLLFLDYNQYEGKPPAAPTPQSLSRGSGGQGVQPTPQEPTEQPPAAPGTGQPPEATPPQ